MGRPYKNLVGQKFGRLTAVKFLGNRGKNGYWECICICGKTTTARSQHLRSGGVGSCGCLGAEMKSVIARTHGACSGAYKNWSKTYISWSAMKARCLVKSAGNFYLYGARGIKICKRWVDNFDNFLEDMGGRPIGKTLDRLNPNGDYNKSNCRWATPKEQANNRRKPTEGKNINPKGGTGIQASRT